ncbi:MAG: xanthine dehydrogenase family protein subunit M [Thaumarchaeota archaeon]|jgi:carbon-monoxide dehydrogenase medium subunit|nr:xanthine dehydrogenase family protein subunit M [Candidatus Geocrenenecus arthurdayi]MCL7404314.1 xanthine dehydrogenase family protein subunit M [Candidatus Geocrenenecus arthurdayi]
MNRGEFMRADYINLVNTHIIPIEFTYHAPETLEEALKLLREYQGQAMVIAGGTDLIVDMKLRRKEPKHIISLGRIRELDYIIEEDSGIRIGAATKLRSIEKSRIVYERFEALHLAVKSIASIQVRNMGTLVGNICNASPAADSAPPLLIYEAIVTAQNLEGARKILMRDFFTGPGKTCLRNDEIVTEIFIPYPPRDSTSSFLKISRVGMDLAKVNIALLLKFNSNVVEDFRIALGAVAPTPLRILRAEEYLKHKPVNEENLRKVEEIVVEEIKPITDVRSTEWYRREVSKALVRDALNIAVNKVMRK